MFKKYQEFIPKSIFCLKRYTLSLLKKDLLSGITVGIVAFPLAMAFAMASGVSPERGLYTAVVAGFLISFLGGSRVQIGGPTGAFVVVVYSIVQRHGYEGLVLATLMASGLLLLMGFCRLGNWIKYIPHPLIVGFTSGIAVLIFSSQIKDFLGLQLESVPVSFLGKWQAYFSAFPTLNGLTVAVAASSLIVILLIRKYFPTLPWGIATIFLATACCTLFELPVDTIVSRFGEIPRSLPSPVVPTHFSKFFELIPDALTIALLAGVESLFSAVIADNMIGSRHKSNCELIAQGVANLGSVLCGGIPATAAIARTATNIKTGAQTPVSGMIHAVVVFLIMFFFAPIAGQIPLSALSAVLVMVAWNMLELPHFVQLLKAPKADVVILLTSFLLTVLVDITVAVEVGMILAAFLFMKRMGDMEHVVRLHTQDETEQVYDLRGPLFFGVTDRLKELYKQIEQPRKTCVLRMKHVPVLDASGLYALREFQEKLAKDNTQLILSHVQKEPALLLRKFGLGELIREETTPL